MRRSGCTSTTRAADGAFARYYDPKLGRFISADTIVPAPGNPQSLNRYSYVYNNPLKYVDVDGHFPWIVAGGLAGMAIAYGGQVVGNLNSGMELGAALTTNIDTRAIATGGLIGMAAGTGIGLLAPGMASLATGGTLATAAGTTVSAACADGDCSNEVQSVANGVCGGDCSDELEASGQIIKEGLVYRGGSATPRNLTPRPGIDLDGLSMFNNLESAAAPGGKAQVIDVAQLPGSLQAVFDNSPPGHVSIRPFDYSLIPEWAATRGTDYIHPFTQGVMDAIIGVERVPK